MSCRPRSSGTSQQAWTGHVQEDTGAHTVGVSECGLRHGRVSSYGDTRGVSKCGWASRVCWQTVPGSRGVHGVSEACVSPWPLFRTSRCQLVSGYAVRLPFPWLPSLSEPPYGPPRTNPCQPWCLERRVCPDSHGGVSSTEHSPVSPSCCCLLLFRLVISKQRAELQGGYRLRASEVWVRGSQSVRLCPEGEDGLAEEIQ